MRRIDNCTWLIFHVRQGFSVLSSYCDHVAYATCTSVPVQCPAYSISSLLMSSIKYSQHTWKSLRVSSSPSHPLWVLGSCWTCAGSTTGHPLRARAQLIVLSNFKLKSLVKYPSRRTSKWKWNLSKIAKSCNQCLSGPKCGEAMFN